MKPSHLTTFLALATAFVLAVAAFPAVPQTINYQGYLKDTAGTPVSSATSIRFSLYSSIRAGSGPVWTETTSVTPANGIYSVQLGSITPITATFDVPYWLGVKVAGDDEMALQALTSVPYAMRAEFAATALCKADDILSCYTGPPATLNVGPCRAGIKVCTQDGSYGSCSGQTLPTTEICFNGIDENCDGQADEGCSLPNGSACTANSMCTSGICNPQDGICCPTACSGLCESCSTGACLPITAGLDPANECTGTGTCGGTCNGARGCQYPAISTDCGTCSRCNGAGSCTFIPADTDPDNDCTTCRTCDGVGACKNVTNGTDTHNDCSDQGPCGLDGTCNGAGACRYYGSSTIFTPASCNAGTNVYSFPDLCNGAGGVTDGGTVSCAPLTCSGTSCRSTCTQQFDCAAGYFCDLGDSDIDGNTSECLPKKVNGSVCTTDANDFECSGGYCNNGYCCGSSTGLCCATSANCSTLAQAATCDVVSTCSGHRVDATCISNVCQTSIPSDSSACSGQTCASGTCTGTGNLTWTPKSVCSSGICTMTAPVTNCDDANVCTNDFCNIATGCSYSYNNTPTLSCYTDTLGNPLGGTPGVGICANGIRQCTNGSFGACIGAVGPTSEACGTTPSRDENCNGQSNEQNAAGCTWFRLDNDQDGYGLMSDTRCYCSPGLPYVGAPVDKYSTSNSGAIDCNDSQAGANPGQTEKCSTAYDDNCNGSINEDNAEGCLVRYLDNDRDGYGTSVSKCSCVPVAPYDSLYSTDCNDTNAAIYPGRTEVCNGIDDNCTGTVDTAEVPIVTLCTTQANSTGSVCNGASGCSPECQQYWYNIDGAYSNGCEVQQDYNDRSYSEDTCGGAVWGGYVYENGYASPYLYDVTGNSVPVGDSDWFYVYAYDSSGGGTGVVNFDVRFLANPGTNYRYDVYQGGCSNLIASGQTGAIKAMTQGYYYIRVYRVSGASPAGEAYTIRISNNLY